MGEHPPLLTPQGPGVARARRPGFPRVEDSGTSCSSFVVFRLLRNLPLFRRLRFWSRLSAFPFHDPIRASPRVSPPLLPKCFPQFPSPSLRPVLSTSFPTFPRPRFILFPLRACTSSTPLSLSPFLRPVPPISSLLPSRPQTFQLFPDLLSNLGSTTPVSGFGFVARESRRSALTPLPRSGKKHRVVTGT